MDDLDLRVGARIRAAREQAGLTQEEVAGHLGLATVSYGAFERGDRQIGIHHLIKVAGVLGRSVNYLLDLPTPEGLTPDEQEVVEWYRAVRNPEIRHTIRGMLKVAADQARRG